MKPTAGNGCCSSGCWSAVLQINQLVQHLLYFSAARFGGAAAFRHSIRPPSGRHNATDKHRMKMKFVGAQPARQAADQAVIRAH